MDREEIMQRAEKVFAKVLKEPDLKLKREQKATDFRRWDSINHMLLIARLEKEFSVEIAIAESVDMVDVGELIDLVVQKMAQGQ